MTRQADLLPEGLADRLPAAAEALSRAMRAALDVMASHGYARVRPSLIEFEAGLASRMEGVEPRRMFRFVDPVSLRTLALRSDITVQVGRIAASSMANAERPLRLCYAGEVALITADQLDPARQRLQLGAELIGNDSVAAAGEIVMLSLEAAEAAGAEDISIDLTLPDLIDVLAAGPLPLSDDEKRAVRRELDAKDAGGLKAAAGGAYLPLLSSMGAFDTAIDALERFDESGVLSARIASLREIAARIGDRARLTLDPTERHGFEYQSWFGFTLFAGNARVALGRGGSYVIRGCDEPAVGFSLYIDPLIDAVSTPSTTSNTLFLPLDHDPEIAARMRSVGWRTIAALNADDEPGALGCSYVLRGAEPEKLP